MQYPKQEPIWSYILQLASKLEQQQFLTKENE